MTITTPPSPYPDSPYLVAMPESRKRGAATVLLATDGDERSDGAVRVAVARADATGALLEVISVVRTEPAVSPEGVYLDSGASHARREEQRRLIEAQLTRVLSNHEIYSISVFDGNPAYTISRVAVERHAALIVVGLGRHAIANRLFSEETALQLARISRVPVLAVPDFMSEAPRHAVVAVDFSELSSRAAQAAIEAVADVGQVDLVHVIVTDGADSTESRPLHAEWARSRLAALREQLVFPAGVKVACEVVFGNPASAILDYGTRVGATLVATGTHGRGFVARAMLGSVTTKLLRGATCALLTLPRDPLPALAPERHVVDPAGLSWTAMLDDFTKRNAGRRTILEVDDLEIGAQAQEYNYPLLGVSYSDRDGRLDLMLGDNAADGRHLARTMRSIVAVDVLKDGDGRDVALRVLCGASQTLLTFAA